MVCWFLIVFPKYFFTLLLVFAREVPSWRELFFCFELLLLLSYRIYWHGPSCCHCPWDSFGGRCCLYPISSSTCSCSLVFRSWLESWYGIRYHLFKEIAKWRIKSRKLYADYRNRIALMADKPMIRSRPCSFTGRPRNRSSNCSRETNGPWTVNYLLTHHLSKWKLVLCQTVISWSYLLIAGRDWRALYDGLKTTVGRTTNCSKEGDGVQGIQFRVSCSGSIQSDQIPSLYKEMIRYLKRQLETIIGILGGKHVSYKYIFNMAVGISVFLPCALLYCQLIRWFTAVSSL